MHGVLIRRCARLAVACFVTCACALAMTGCGGDDQTPDLDGTSWRLTGWSVSSLDPADFTITADFDDGRIGGLAAVNNYGGPYETGPDGEFSIGALSSTMMAATGDDGRAEENFFELLESAASYEAVGDTLTLFDEFGNEALIFETARE